MSGPWFVAQRIFLRQRRNQRQGHPLLGAVLGIALSLVPLVTVDHIAAGMIEGIVGRYRETSTYHFQVHAWGTPDRGDWQAAADSLAARDGVGGAWVERQGFGLARMDDRREGLTLRAVPAGLPEFSPGFRNYIEFDSGRWDLDGNSILLGREAARRLDAAVGDTIRVLTARRLGDGRYVPRVSRFVVRGVFTSGYQDLDRTWAFVSLEAGWPILSPESSRTFVGGILEDPSNRPDLAVAALGPVLPEGWMPYDWMELNRYLIGNLQSTRSILLIIMALIIIVAVLNVMSSLVMLVLERQREIGILKCTGSSPADITATFLIAGMLAAGAGTIIGLGIGLLVSGFINQIIASIEFLLGLLPGSASGGRLLNEGYYLQIIPIVIRWRAAALIGTATFVLSLAASALPAARAGALKPLEVLRRH